VDRFGSPLELAVAGIAPSSSPPLLEENAGTTASWLYRVRSSRALRNRPQLLARGSNPGHRPRLVRCCATHRRAGPQAGRRVSNQPCGPAPAAGPQLQQLQGVGRMGMNSHRGGAPGCGRAAARFSSRASSWRSRSHHPLTGCDGSTPRSGKCVQDHPADHPFLTPLHRFRAPPGRLSCGAGPGRPPFSVAGVAEALMPALGLVRVVDWNRQRGRRPDPGCHQLLLHCAGEVAGPGKPSMVSGRQAADLVHPEAWAVMIRSLPGSWACGTTAARAASGRLPIRGADRPRCASLGGRRWRQPSQAKLRSGCRACCPSARCHSSSTTGVKRAPNSALRLAGRRHRERFGVVSGILAYS